MISLEQGQDRIIRRSHDLAAHAEARIAIGVLPSSGHDSALTEKVAQAVSRIHMRNPDWHLQVIESSNLVLHDRVRAGELNLAIVGVVAPQVGRIPLGASEQLCLVCHPSIDLGGRGEVDIETVCRMPLVLGPRHLGIHRSFAEAARNHRQKLQPVVEVGSLPLAVAMVKQAPLCTILPASSVRKDIERGALTVVPIDHEELQGALWVIFSPDRELSEAERSIIQEFVATFREGTAEGDARRQ
jgi:DNA-binding transcriptional LysR family regulator